LHNLVGPYTTSIWDDSDNNFIENDELCVMRYYDISFSSDRIKNTNDLNNEAGIKKKLSILKSLIHDLSFQREIIERLQNKILKFELNVQSHEFKF
jgi:hypothetical protein